MFPYFGVFGNFCGRIVDLHYLHVFSSTDLYFSICWIQTGFCNIQKSKQGLKCSHSFSFVCFFLCYVRQEEDEEVEDEEVVDEGEEEEVGVGSDGEDRVAVVQDLHPHPDLLVPSSPTMCRPSVGE